MDPFQVLANNIKSQIESGSLNSSQITDFQTLSTDIITLKGLFENQISAVDDFLKSLPTIINSLISARRMSNFGCLDTLLRSLGELMIWAMRKSDQKLIELFFKISDPSIKYSKYDQNNRIDTSCNYPLFDHFVEQFFDQNPDSPCAKLIEDLCLGTFSNPISLLIYSFLFRTFAESHDDLEDSISILLIYFGQFVCENLKEDVKAVQDIKTQYISILIRSIDKLKKVCEFPSEYLIHFLVVVFKTNQPSKQLISLEYLNRYSMEDSSDLGNVFADIRQDLMRDIINADLEVDYYVQSKHLLTTFLQESDILPLFEKACTYFPQHQLFFFYLISEYLSRNYPGMDKLSDFLEKLESDDKYSNKVELLMLNLILFLILENQWELDTSDRQTIFQRLQTLTQRYSNSCLTTYKLFFQELDKTPNNEQFFFLEFHIALLSTFLACLSIDSLNDHIFYFLSKRFILLRDILKRSGSPGLIEHVRNLLTIATRKVKEYATHKEKVTEELLYFQYVILFFKNMKWIHGPINDFRVSETHPSTVFILFFITLDYAKNDETLLNYGIGLFSQFFTRCDNLRVSITKLYETAITYLEYKDSIKRLFLQLIYKVLKDLEHNYELIDFENSIRNHTDEKKGKIKIRFRYKDSNDKSIWAYPNNTVELLLYRLAMRLNGLPNMFEITDNQKKPLNPSDTVSTLINRQPLIVNSLFSDKYDRKVYYSASDTLASLNFTKNLTKIIETSSELRTQKLAYKILSYLPSDPEIINMSIDQFIEAVNNAKNDYIFYYLLQCACHFSIDKKTGLSSQLSKIWNQIKAPRSNSAPVLDFIYCIFTDSISLDQKMFIGGRVFKTFLTKEKKSYRSAMELFISSGLCKYLDINDNRLLCDTILAKCTKDEWPYLREMYLHFSNKSPLFTYCVEKMKSDKRQYKYVYKILTCFISELLPFLSSDKESILSMFAELPTCTSEQFNDNAQLISSLCSFEKLKYFVEQPGFLPKLLNYSFTKCSDQIDSNILPLIGDHTHKKITNVIMKYVGKECNVWNYRNTDHVQNELGYVGLRNLAATCYMNSLFQVLHQLPDFLTELFKSTDKTIFHLQRIMASLLLSKRDIIDPKLFIDEWAGGWNKKIVDYRKPQDVIEFFLYLIEDFPEEAQNLFRGEYVISRQAENYNTTTTEMFQVITAKVKGFTNLKDSLHSTIEPEILTNYEIQPNVRKSIQQITKIKTNPKILFIQLNRNEYDEHMNPITVNHRFEFPELLNLSYLMDDNRNCYYTLHSIICHSSYDPSGGHYYTLLRNKSTEPLPDQKERGYYTSTKSRGWVKINDSNVTELTSGYEEEAFGGSTNDFSNVSAAVLIYVLNEPVHIEHPPTSNQTPSFTDSSNIQENVYKKYSHNRSDVEYEEFDNVYNISEEHLNAVQKDNEQYSIYQRLFSLDFADFLAKSSFNTAKHYYLFNVVMHGTDVFCSKFPSLTESIDLVDAAKYVVNNIDHFYLIYQNETSKDLLDLFYSFSRKLMNTPHGSAIAQWLISIPNFQEVRNAHYFLGLIEAHYTSNHSIPEPLPVIERLISITENLFLTSNLNISPLISTLSSIIQFSSNIEENMKLVNIQFFKDNFESLKNSPDYRSSFLLLVEHFVRYELIDVSKFLQFDNLTIDDYANALNEKNFMLIASNLSENKINDLLNKIVNGGWTRDKIEKIASSVLEDGMFDLKKRSIFFFFLNNPNYPNYYKYDMILNQLASSNNCDLDLIQKLLNNSNMQNKKTLEYLLKQIKEKEEEEEKVKLIRLMSYLINHVDVEEFFNVVFDLETDDEAIILNRLNAFLSATQLKPISRCKCIVETQAFAKYRPIFEKSQPFIERYRKFLPNCS